MRALRSAVIAAVDVGRTIRGRIFFLRLLRAEQRVRARAKPIRIRGRNCRRPRSAGRVGTPLINREGRHSSAPAAALARISLLAVVVDRPRTWRPVSSRGAIVETATGHREERVSVEARRDAAPRGGRWRGHTPRGSSGGGAGSNAARTNGPH